MPHDPDPILETVPGEPEATAAFVQTVGPVCSRIAHDAVLTSRESERDELADVAADAVLRVAGRLVARLRAEPDPGELASPPRRSLVPERTVSAFLVVWPAGASVVGSALTMTRHTDASWVIEVNHGPEEEGIAAALLWLDAYQSADAALRALLDAVAVRS